MCSLHSVEESGVFMKFTNAMYTQVHGKIKDTHSMKIDNMRSIESDDLVSAMSIETYVLYRARPLAALLEQRAPWLVRILQLLEVLVFISNSLGAVLALTSVGRVPLATFVALSVSFASVFSSMIEYHNLQQQVK